VLRLPLVQGATSAPAARLLLDRVPDGCFQRRVDEVQGARSIV